MMNRFYPNLSYFSNIYKIKDLPLIVTSEFDFFRCVKFDERYFYDKTASKMFRNNLRESDARYSHIFGNQKISYWADTKRTAMCEIRKHGAGKNVITFWAYDDATSTFPTVKDRSQVLIVDGTKLGFDEILNKTDNGIPLSTEDKKQIEVIMSFKPDCLAYKSHVVPQGVNYIFFENGFKKLSLREIKLYMGERRSKNSNQITCAYTSDYSPNLESYGEYFYPIAGVKMDGKYLRSTEYHSRQQQFEKSIAQFKAETD